ncbi:MAG: lasso peptide isopeptide bond-forming cyclase [Methanothrix sp.]
MSAIAGVYLLDGSAVDPRDLKKMNDSLSHRGPDGSGLWHEGPVGLAHQMLWTTPESLQERLPLEADGLVITSDSRIDNRDILIPDLNLSEEASDSEVILMAYVNWGRSCADKLLGDFAFAIWDTAKKELFCARDHMGVKPFYYYYQPGRVFAFATEIRALFAWGVPIKINEVRIGDYIASVWEDREITFYQEILRLPAAHVMVSSQSGLQIERYWELDPKREILLGSDEEYEKAFRDIFGEAVRCRLRSAFPVGSMLSGGLDSSSIVCMARCLLPKGCILKTFSMIFKIKRIDDERHFMDSVQAAGNLEPHYVYGDRTGPLTKIDEMLWYVGQPITSPNLFMLWELNNEVRNQRVRVLLDGFGGDSVVSYGTAYITELFCRLRLIAVHREISSLKSNFGVSYWKQLFISCIYPLIPACLIRLWRKLRVINGKEPIDYDTVKSSFAKRIRLKDRINALHGERCNPCRKARDDQWLDLSHGFHQLVLEETNMAAGAFSIDHRFPFYDKRLVEFCLALPTDQKIRHGCSRWIMRHALNGFLPEEVCNRFSKTSHGPNFTYCLLSFHSAALDDIIIKNYDILEDFVDIFSLQEIYKRIISTKKLLSNDDLYAWRIMTLIFWIRGVDP